MDSTTPLDPRPVAPDGSEKGPFEIATDEYRLPPAIDDSVLPGVPTEVWAQVTYPKAAMGALPLLVFLHGNYATCGMGTNPRKAASCEYTKTGVCPSGQIVIPSHLGFDYLAERLASHGYLVVSINANRGINCDQEADAKNATTPPTSKDPGLIVARARLVLKHLALLQQWNDNGGAPSDFNFKGRIDFDHVGFLGHSRGGEAMRAAYLLSQESVGAGAMTVRGIFEIAPTDRNLPRFHALNTAWNVLLPMCDGDVFSLEGRRPFDRMIQADAELNATPKSMLVVWGANHAYYNTAWQTSDSQGCAGPNRIPIWNGYVGSEKIQKTALVSVLSFFRAHVGNEKNYGELFDPLFVLPRSLSDITAFNRAYLKSPALAKKFALEPFASSRVSVVFGGVPEHDPSLRAALVSWNLENEEGFFESLWSESEKSGLDLREHETFDFRVSRADHEWNDASATNFDIQLIFEGGVLGNRLSLKNYTTLLGPVGGVGNTPGTEHLHSILQSVRIPLKDLGVCELRYSVRGVRFTFPKKSKGSVYFSDFLATLKAPL